MRRRRWSKRESLETGGRKAPRRWLESRPSEPARRGRQRHKQLRCGASVGGPVGVDWTLSGEGASLRIVEIPVCDNVLLTVDPQRDTRGAGDDPGRRDDREFWLADEAGRQVVQWDRVTGTARVLDGATARVVAVHDKERGITTYEAQIPWREILPAGQQPATGQVYDLQLVVNDFDEGTDPMPQTRIGLTFGVGPVVDPGLFASMMLLADASALRGVVPEFPPKPGVKDGPLPGERRWRQWPWDHGAQVNDEQLSVGQHAAYRIYREREKDRAP